MPAPATDSARAIGAGFLYFVLIFALGFALGVARTLLLQNAPGVGRLTAVLIELPIMLAASWFVCAAIVRRLGVPKQIPARLAMGATAFACLLAAETAIGLVVGGRTLATQVALYAEPSYALGLAAQIAFALIPLLQMRTP